MGNLRNTEIARILLDAAARLDPVNVLTDAAPQQNLSAAYDDALRVYKSEALSSKNQKALRIAALGIRAVRDVLDKNGSVRKDDNVTVAKAAAQFREIAASVAPASASVPAAQPTMKRSALGVRMHDLRELADFKPFVELPSHMHHTEVSEFDDEDVQRDINYIAHINQMKSKLPTTLKPGQPFLIVRMPIAVSTKRAVSTSELKRSGLKWYQFRTRNAAREVHVMNKRLPPESSNTTILENQIVVCMRKGETEDYREAKRAFGKIRPTVMGKKPGDTMVAGAANRAKAMVDAKFGECVNPLEHVASGKYFRSPGSSLEYMWLVPAHVFNDIKSFVIRSVAFPWMSQEAPQHRESREKDLREELKELEAQQALLLKHGEHLDRTYLDKISAIRNQLYDIDKTRAPSPQEKEARLADLKKKLEEETEKQFGAVSKRIAALEKELKDDPSNSTLKRELKLSKKILADGREMIAARLRKMAR